ncbi:MAG: PEP-CTERM sorting domain-containing protein [Gammaproteobacteria bacterium]|nr:PEP-CTERM sorting domain-containing protein [Gammaproteobacteria bacterium]
MAIGGYSWDSTIATGLLNMDNFIVIPEPSALSLLTVGLSGLAMLRRRRS